jgi:hypothetical protein
MPSKTKNRVWTSLAKKHLQASNSMPRDQMTSATRDGAHQWPVRMNLCTVEGTTSRRKVPVATVRPCRVFKITSNAWRTVMPPQIRRVKDAHKPSHWEMVTLVQMNASACVGTNRRAVWRSRTAEMGIVRTMCWLHYCGQGIGHRLSRFGLLGVRVMRNIMRLILRRRLTLIALSMKGKVETTWWIELPSPALEGGRDEVTTQSKSIHWDE